MRLNGIEAIVEAGGPTLAVGAKVLLSPTALVHTRDPFTKLEACESGRVVWSALQAFDNGGPCVVWYFRGVGCDRLRLIAPKYEEESAGCPEVKPYEGKTFLPASDATFNMRSNIRRYGGKWDAEQRGYYIPDHNYDVVFALVEAYERNAIEKELAPVSAILRGFSDVQKAAQAAKEQTMTTAGSSGTSAMVSGPIPGCVGSIGPALNAMPGADPAPRGLIETTMQRAKTALSSEAEEAGWRLIGRRAIDRTPAHVLRALVRSKVLTKAMAQTIQGALKSDIGSGLYGLGLGTLLTVHPRAASRPWLGRLAAQLRTEGLVRLGAAALDPVLDALDGILENLLEGTGIDILAVQPPAQMPVHSASTTSVEPGVSASVPYEPVSR